MGGNSARSADVGKDGIAPPTRTPDDVFCRASSLQAAFPHCEAKVFHRLRSSRLAKSLKLIWRVRTNDWTSRDNEALVSAVESTRLDNRFSSLHPAGLVLMAGFGQWQRIAAAIVGGES